MSLLNVHQASGATKLTDGIWRWRLTSMAIEALLMHSINLLDYCRGPFCTCNSREGNGNMLIGIALSQGR